MKRTIQPLLGCPKKWKLSLQLFTKLILFVAFLFTQFDVIAQCNNLTCKSGIVPVYLNNSCQANIIPQQMLLTPPTDCPGAKTVIAFNNMNQVVAPPFTAAQIGVSLTYTVFDVSSGKSCSGQFAVLDTISPTLVCQGDITVNCNVNISPANLPAPIAFDNCAGPSFTLTNTDVLINNPCPQADVLFRTWKATDASGNTKTCVTKITLKRPLVTDVTFNLATNFILPCNTNPNNLQVLGQPTLNGNPIGYSSSCDFVSSKSDSIAPAVLPLTGVTYFRTWVVTDLCTGNTTSALQVFTVADTQAPTITCPPNITLESTAQTCINPITLAQPIVTDNCLTNPDIIVNWPFGTTFGPYFNVPSGVYPIEYIVTDYGQNTAICSYTLIVIDTITPVALCKGNIVLSISNAPPSVLMPSSVDNGSYDNCGIVSYELDRLDDAQGFLPSLSFGCDDAGDTIQILLKVTDPSGLFSICQSQVVVQDKIAPFIICAHDVTVDCDIDFGDFTQFGDITVSEPCIDSIDIKIIDNINNCRVGNYQRVFTVSDAAGNTAVCTQTINVINTHPFNGDSIVWPPDLVIYDCASPDNFDVDSLAPPYNGPVIPNTDPCALIAINHEDHLFTVAQPSCYKIMRVWKVIDWCQYDPINESTGVWTHTQLIKMQDTIDPVLVCPPVINGSVGPDCKTGSVIMAPVTAIDCNPKVKITNDSKYSIAKGADASGIYPVGTTKVTFTASDLCGNFTTCSVLVVVTDDKKPTPKCLFGLATDMVYMGVPGVMSMVPAKAFNAGSTDNCTPGGDLIFSYSSDTSDTKKVFTCDELGINNIEVWVTDANGNQDYCITFIDVQDNMFPCPVQLTNDTIYISGNITSESNQKLENVNLQLSGKLTKDLMTKKDGNYMFSPLPKGEDFEVVPAKADLAINGISTLDLLYIQQHILGSKSLGSPYKIIAADVDGSKKITVGDVVILKKLILHQINEFPGQPSWKFIDKNYQFPNPFNPWLEEIPVKFYDTHIMENKTGVDFLGIKLGDVNGSAKYNSVGENEVRGKAEILPITYEDQSFKAGETVNFSLKIGKDENLKGLQFTVNFDTDLINMDEVLSQVEVGLSAEDVYYDKTAGRLHISWINPDGSAFIENNHLINLQLRPKKAGKLSELISLSDNDNYPEALTVNQDILKPVLLAQDSHSKQLQFTLFQNKPNPFAGNTQISFYMTEPTLVKLKIMDMTGKLVYEKTDNYNSGLQEVNIDASQLSGPGVYIYSIETDKYSATARMILLQ